MPGQGDQPLGHDRAGIDADDAQPVARRGAAHRAGERHQRRVAGGPGDVVEIGVLAGRAEDVDDDALFALGHQRVKAPRHVDVAEHFEVPGLAPALLVDLGDVAARDRAGIVDEKVDVGAFGGELVDILAVAEIERVVAHRDIVLAGDLGAHLVEVRGGARHQHDVTALLRQSLGAGLPDPL